MTFFVAPGIRPAKGRGVILLHSRQPGRDTSST
jgi:hypothetical protein